MCKRSEVSFDVQGFEKPLQPLTKTLNTCRKQKEKCLFFIFVKHLKLIYLQHVNRNKEYYSIYKCVLYWFRMSKSTVDSTNLKKLDTRGFGNQAHDFPADQRLYSNEINFFCCAADRMSVYISSVFQNYQTSRPEKHIFRGKPDTTVLF